MSLVTPPASGSRVLALTTGHLSRVAYKRLAELQDEYRSSKRSKSSSKKTQTMGRIVQQRGGSGFFKGSFGPLVRTTPKIDDIVMTKGSGVTAEYHGFCQGTEIVWVGASTCNLAIITNEVIKAVLRKLLKQAGMHITNAALPFSSAIAFLGPISPNTGVGFVLRVTSVDGGGTPYETTYQTVAAESLNSFVTNSTLVTQLADYAKGTSEKIPMILRLYQYDQNTGGTDTAKLVATLNMNNEMIHMYLSVKMVIQNRTKGAAGATENLDVIDAQPLKGRMYYFKKTHPEVREMPGLALVPNTTSLLSRWPEATVKLLSDTSAGYDNQLYNPPSPQFFNNCSKSASITLEPGDLKEVNISNLTEKYFPEFVRSLAWYNGFTGARRQKIGDCILIALEERLNSGSSNPIRVQYEAEHNVSVYATTNRVDPLVKNFYTEVVNHS